MRKLADQPDLNQLRRQARELQRAPAAREPEAAARLGAVAMRPTLSAALLALAREHGFSSWPRLKTEAERRARLRVRPVASPVELEAAFDVVGAQFTPPMTHDDRRFADLARRFAEDRLLMQVALDGDRIAGGAFAFRRGVLLLVARRCNVCDDRPPLPCATRRVTIAASHSRWRPWSSQRFPPPDTHQGVSTG